MAGGKIRIFILFHAWKFLRVLSLHAALETKEKEEHEERAKKFNFAIIIPNSRHLVISLSSFPLPIQGRVDGIGGREGRKDISRDLRKKTPFSLFDSHFSKVEFISSLKFSLFFFHFAPLIEIPPAWNSSACDGGGASANLFCLPNSNSHSMFLFFFRGHTPDTGECYKKTLRRIVVLANLQGGAKCAEFSADGHFQPLLYHKRVIFPLSNSISRRRKARDRNMIVLFFFPRSSHFGKSCPAKAERAPPVSQSITFSGPWRPGGNGLARK